MTIHMTLYKPYDTVFNHMSFSFLSFRKAERRGAKDSSPSGGVRGARFAFGEETLPLFASRSGVKPSDRRFFFFKFAAV